MKKIKSPAKALARVGARRLAFSILTCAEYGISLAEHVSLTAWGIEYRRQVNERVLASDVSAA